MPSDPELHITVVSIAGDVELAEEIRLVKSALLYADRVTLVCQTVVLLAAVAGRLGAPPEARRDQFIWLLNDLVGGHRALEKWNVLRFKPDKTAEESAELERMTRKLDAHLPAMESLIGALTGGGADELERALHAGVLEVDWLNESPIGEARTVEEATGTAFDRVLYRALSRESETYPMIGERLGSLLRRALSEQGAEGAYFRGTTETHLAARLIGGIDAFPDAPMDVVLDARGHLRGPLRRFRGGIARLVSELSNLGIDALDERFDRASVEVYREHVAPALQEIEELSRELGLRNALLRTSPTVARDVALATMALVATSAGGVGELATLAAGATGDLVGRTALRQRELREKRDKNEFVFLYEAEKRLSP